jgi:hypothetical protein
MSQRDVERTLGRLLTDAGFRRHFFLNPALACLALGIQLAPHEVDALLRVSPRRLTDLAEKLDDRICRLDIEPPRVTVEGEAAGCWPDGDPGAGAAPTAKDSGDATTPDPREAPPAVPPSRASRSPGSRTSRAHRSRQ